MSAIRTPRHSTKKRIVINIDSTQTVNLAKRWAVAIGYKNNHYSRHYFKKSAEQAAAHYRKPLYREKVWVEEVDYSHIIDQTGEIISDGWIDVADATCPHKAARELKELLAQL